MAANNKLSKYLTISAPGTIIIDDTSAQEAKQDEILFSNQRMIDMDWEKLLTMSDEELPGDIQILIEKLKKDEVYVNTDTLIGKIVHLIDQTTVRYSFEDEFKSIESGWILTDPYAGREFLINSDPNSVTFEETDFASLDSLVEALKTKLEGFELIFKANDIETNGPPEMEVLDLAAPRIIRAAEELDILEEFTATNVRLAKEWLSRIDTPIFDEGERDRLYASFRSAMMESVQVGELRQRIQDQARDLGYKLKKVGEEWKLFRTITVTRRAWRHRHWLWGWRGHHYRRWWYRWERTYITIKKEVLVTIDYDPWIETEDRLRDEEGYQVFRFLRGEGFRTSEGVPINDILKRCNDSESFRNKCAIMLPTFEQNLLGREELASYIVIKRPMANNEAKGLPAVSLSEDMVLSRAWAGTELGEMLNNIGLAPGEVRSLKIEQKLVQIMSTK